MTRRRTIQKRLLVSFGLAVATLVLIFVGIVRWSNHPLAQQRILNWVNQHTDWEITLDHWQWRLSTSTIYVQNPSLLHRENNHYAHADYIEVHYSPWTLLRGAIKITQLQMTNVIVRVHAMPSVAEPRKRLTLRKMLALQNFEIQDAIIDRISILLSEERSLTAERIALNFDPGLLGRSQLAVQISQPFLFRGNEPLVRLKSLSLTGSTNIKAWVNMAPFVNDVRGALSVQDMQWRTLTVSDLTATANLVNSRISLGALRAVVDQHMLQGDGFIDLGSKSTAMHLEWDEPMQIPELLREKSFFTTAGALQGTIDWKGTSFDPQSLTGTVAVDLTHVPAQITDIPARLQAEGVWNAGRMTLKNSTLFVGESKTDVRGTIDLAQKNLQLEFEGHELPLLGVMGRFRRKDYHPVTGTAHCKGSFRGWKRDYRLELNVDSARDVTYQGIAVEDLRMDLQLTYPQITLHGEILQNGRTTGTTDLRVQYGARQADGSRSSTVQLTAAITGHDLAPSFAAIDLTGIGEGKLTMSGGSDAFRGDATAIIRDGTFSGLPLEEVQSHVTLTPKTVSFAQSTIVIPNVPPLSLPNTFSMQFNGNGFRMQGTPAAGFSVDLSYTGGEGAWTFHDIQYRDPRLGSAFHLTGHGAKGLWDLDLQGNGNAQWLEYIPSVFREAEGPLQMRVHLRGTLAKPQLAGSITLQNNRLLLRAMDQEWTDLSGSLQLSGARIQFTKVRGFLGDGPFTLNGWAEQEGLFAYPRYDLHLQGESLYFTMDDRKFRADFDTDLHITCTDGDTTHIRGNLALIEGLYTRDFRLLEQATRRQASVERERLRMEMAGYDKVHLDIEVQSRGEIVIRNNIGDIPLRARVKLIGTAADPKIRGTIESTNGQMHYLGLDLEVVTGVVEFHPPLLEPFIEFRGEETVGTHLVQVILRGPINKLQVELQSIPGEDRKNVLCLIAYGATCDQLRFAQFGAKIGPGIFIEQLGRVLQRPISKITGLDRVRVESVAGSADLSQLYLGKRLSDRLEVSFVTTVGQTAADQSLEAAYQITDFLLLKARQSTRHKTQGNISLRFRER